MYVYLSVQRREVTGSCEVGAWRGGDAEGQLEVLGPLEGPPVGDTVGEATYPSQAGIAPPGAQGRE